jgi:hypothetical protein
VTHQTTVSLSGAVVASDEVSLTIPVWALQNAFEYTGFAFIREVNDTYVQRTDSPMANRTAVGRLINFDLRLTELGSDVVQS